MYDIEALKSISCEEICSKYGIQLKKSGKYLWGKIRSSEKTSSFSITPSKNSWYDYGNAKGGGSIQLVAEIEGISKANIGQAMKRLAELFNIEKVNQDKNTWIPPTESQYERIGLYSQRATMNFDIDLRKHSLERVEYWNEKFGVPLNELAKKYPNMYNELVERKGLEVIQKDRKIYIDTLMNYRSEKHELTRELYKRELMDHSEEINNKIYILEKALTNDKRYTHLKVDIEKDIDIISFMEKEIGRSSECEPIKTETKRDTDIGKSKYSEFVKLEGKNRYVLISGSEYEKLKTSELNYSAFQKEKGINLVIKEKDLEKALKFIGREYQKTLGNITYKDLKALGASYREISKKISDKVISQLNKNNIKFNAFFNDHGKVNIAVERGGVEKLNNIINQITTTKKMDIGR